MSEHLILTLSVARSALSPVCKWENLSKALGRAGIEYDAERRISTGDVAWSDSALSALRCARFLPDTFEVRRAIVGMILPTVKRAATHTTDTSVVCTIAGVEQWLACGDETSLVGAATTGDVTKNTPADEMARQAARSLVATTRTVKEAWETVWLSLCAHTAAAIAQARASSGGAVWDTEVAHMAGVVEGNQQRADIIAASPPLAFAKVPAHD